MAEYITSLSNARIRRVAELCGKSRARKREQAFVIEGERLFTDTPERYLREIYVTEAFIGSAGPAALQILAKMPYTVVTEAVMSKVSDTKSPQGILCVAEMPSYREEDLLGTGEGGAAVPALLLAV